MERFPHNLFKQLMDDDSTEDVYMPFHPMLASMLISFDGRKSNRDVAIEFSRMTGFHRETIESFIKKMITELHEEEKGKYLKFGDYTFYLPKNLLLKNRISKLKRNLTLDDFRIPKNELDVTGNRSYIPTDCHLEINFDCFTDCVYCYADRRNTRSCRMSIEKIKEIIKDAKNLRMRRFDLSGGEVFLYKHWELLLKELIDNGFMPYISTKIPLTETTIKKIKDLGLKGIQISIDSLDNTELKRLLNVNDDYLPNMLKTLKLLDKEGIYIATNTQITNINDNIHRFKDMMEFLVQLEHIKSIRVGVPGFSIYKSQSNFLEIAPSLSEVLKIEELMPLYKERYKNISISFSGYSKGDLLYKTNEEKEKGFKERARCSANFYAFVILPDGKVTICEELYYHPRFQIGDLQKQSIIDVWTSDRALELYRLTGEMKRAESACNRCEKFVECHTIKGVCWRNILIAYGYDNWDFPDPKCPYAPMPKNRYWIE
jgi:radical SAM protein with 4Fe4S-binding SPASM domain